jgi:hypothetical protein
MPSPQFISSFRKVYKLFKTWIYVKITSDVKLFMVKKPKSYVFKAGQASELSTTEPVWKNEKQC